MESHSSSIIISSDLSNIKKIFTWLEKSLFKLIKNKEKISSLSLVIEEALVNAIVHGNHEDKSKEVFLSYELKNTDVILEIKDEGKGISKDKQEKSSENISPEDLLKESGRGIILIKHFCKEVKFNKNSLHLVFGDI